MSAAVTCCKLASRVYVLLVCTYISPGGDDLTWRPCVHTTKMPKINKPETPPEPMALIPLYPYVFRQSGLRTVTAVLQLGSRSIAKIHPEGSRRHHAQSVLESSTYDFGRVTAQRSARLLAENATVLPDNASSNIVNNIARKCVISPFGPHGSSFDRSRCFWSALLAVIGVAHAQHI